MARAAAAPLIVPPIVAPLPAPSTRRRREERHDAGDGAQRARSKNGGGGGSKSNSTRARSKSTNTRARSKSRGGRSKPVSDPVADAAFAAAWQKHLPCRIRFMCQRQDHPTAPDVEELTGLLVAVKKKADLRCLYEFFILMRDPLGPDQQVVPVAERQWALVNGECCFICRCSVIIVALSSPCGWV